MPKLDHAASLTSSDAASKQKATLQQRTTNRKSINTGYNVLFLRRKVASWLLATFNPRGPYPILLLQGEAGSAKSTTSRVLRELIDPNTSPLRSEPRGNRELMIAAI